ncbi:1-deoxy-D-xylulose-5-phosphate synthase [Amycolatopsis rhabdoformis]|uniref:1-deoxy-D-xylulose-5-phosphate synthase n=1 Tax=Amycolatopsis rhabdoformis TaxID=1448059 RepID=A0ABZ1IJG0_9PSEU|nr:1-deoxy-D-xylulose-5-phosphate synthase [Amycolatopsis rhabdoformis]WSE33694.1 1-deoxy-D-xylulose-5-phosphate synthase [Amycolatopsis rhabdoformis]
MGSLLEGLRGPRDVRRLSGPDRVALCGEIREFLVRSVSATGGHLGPNLGVVELTLALHLVFDSPDEPILFDVGHQAYVHKILTGRAAEFDGLRQTKGLSGYPSRAESSHDWIESSHASAALSHADGMAKGLALRGEPRCVVAVVGDGALTGGMTWEALNNIAAAKRPVVIVVNDNGRSYSPTAGALAARLAELRLRPGYERVLHGVKDTLGRTPVVGAPVYEALHGLKRGVKDVLAPQGMFEDLGLKYTGPVDGHDLVALEKALKLAKDFGEPVLVHVVTRKGNGYAPAETDEVEQMHAPGAFDPVTGRARPKKGRSWTSVFSEELAALGAERDDLVAITAAMREPTGLGKFARAFPERFFDVGIAEQHAVTSAAGLAATGAHPVVALYATFLNRAFDQLLFDVALHRLPVTLVLDRAGITGADGPSHHGVWDYALLGMVPGLVQAAPRDEATLRAALRTAVDHQGGPSVVRFPKSPLVESVPALRSAGGVDVLSETGEGDVEVLVIAIGHTGVDVVAAAADLAAVGLTVRVVDPRWVKPLPEGLVDLARGAALVVTVEDGVVAGGVGARIGHRLHEAGVDTPLRELGVPDEFLEHGSIADLREWVGLTADGIAGRITKWAWETIPAALAAAEPPPRSPAE